MKSNTFNAKFILNSLFIFLIMPICSAWAEAEEIPSVTIDSTSIDHTGWHTNESGPTTPSQDIVWYKLIFSNIPANTGAHIYMRVMGATNWGGGSNLNGVGNITYENALTFGSGIHSCSGYEMKVELTDSSNNIIYATETFNIAHDPTGECGAPTVALVGESITHTTATSDKILFNVSWDGLPQGSVIALEYKENGTTTWNDIPGPGLIPDNGSSCSPYQSVGPIPHSCAGFTIKATVIGNSPLMELASTEVSVSHPPEGDCMP